MTTTTTRRHLLAGAAAVPLLPAVAGANLLSAEKKVSPDRTPGEIDWPAVRERIAYAGDVLEIPPAEVRAVLALSDAELNEGLGVIEFGMEHEISLDWLVGGDVRSLLRIWRRHYRPAHKPDPAVAAYREWFDAHHARDSWMENKGGWEDGDPEHEALLAAEWAAEEALASAVPTTPEGAAMKIHLLLLLLGCAEALPADWRDPETFTSWMQTSESDRDCALSLLAGLRQMGSQA